MIDSNADQVAANTLARFEAIEEEYEDQLEQTVHHAQALAKENVPVDEGDLRDDISIVVGDGWGKVYNTLPYAPAQNFGTESLAPITIRPVEAEVLHFEVDGEEVFTKEVQHPGVPATFYMTDGAEEAFRDSIKRIEAWT